jgi:hypothetical protein
MLIRTLLRLAAHTPQEIVTATDVEISLCSETRMLGMMVERELRGFYTHVVCTVQAFKFSTQYCLNLYILFIFHFCQKYC